MNQPDKVKGFGEEYSKVKDFFCELESSRTRLWYKNIYNQVTCELTVQKSKRRKNTLYLFLEQSIYSIFLFLINPRIQIHKTILNPPTPLTCIFIFLCREYNKRR